MNVFQLTCFLTVAEQLNFARAAEQLDITQPAVTHQIQSLEKELGSRLFIRSTHSVQLTAAGQLLIDDARTIVSTSLRTQERFKHIHEQALSTFTVGCHTDGYLQNLPEILREFIKLYPDIHPQVHMVPSLPLLFRMLDDEKADIVFGIRDSSGKHPGIYKELIKSPIVCVCSIEHPLADLHEIILSDLQKEKLILFDTTKASFFSASSQGKLMTGRAPEDLYFCESTMTAMILAKSMNGVFLLPEILVPRDEDIVFIPIRDAGTESFGMYYRTIQNNKPLKDFISVVTPIFK